MIFVRCHALSTALISLAVVFVDGQDYRYQTYGRENYPPPHSSLDRNLPQSSNPYNPQLNQYGQQTNYQNRPLYNQPGRPGTPSYRSNGYPVSWCRSSDQFPLHCVVSCKKHSAEFSKLSMMSNRFETPTVVYASQRLDV